MLACHAVWVLPPQLELFGPEVKCTDQTECHQSLCFRIKHTDERPTTTEIELQLTRERTRKLDCAFFVQNNRLFSVSGYSPHDNYNWQGEMFAPNVKLKDSTQSFEVSVGKHFPSTRYCHGCFKSPFQSVDPDQETWQLRKQRERNKNSNGSL